MKDYRIWVEVAERKRKCHRCDGEICKGVMFVRSGDRGSPRRARSICATCFEAVMDDLSHDFESLKTSAPLVEPALMGPRCFACGMEPERCRCGHEAYR